MARTPLVTARNIPTLSPSPSPAPSPSRHDRPRATLVTDYHHSRTDWRNLMRDHHPLPISVTLTQSDDPAIARDWDALWDWLCALVLDPEPRRDEPDPEI